MSRANQTTRTEERENLEKENVPLLDIDILSLAHSYRQSWNIRTVWGVFVVATIRYVYRRIIEF
jgi:hypothetical protein